MPSATSKNGPEDEHEDFVDDQDEESDEYDSGFEEEEAQNAEGGEDDVYEVVSVSCEWIGGGWGYVQSFCSP